MRSERGDPLLGGGSEGRRTRFVREFERNVPLYGRTFRGSTGGNPVTNAFGYTLFGDLAFLEYSDGTPSVYYHNYNRAGLPRQIVDAAGENELVYDHASRLVLTTNVNGLLAGLAVSNRFDGVHGRSLLQVLGASTPVSHAFAYDNYGRLGSVASGVFSAGYGYLGDSDLLQTTTCKSNSTPILTTTRSWDYGMRLGVILNEVGGGNVSSHSYDYDTANRRTGARLQDGSFWLYDYNHRDELTGARRYWYDLMPVAGQQFGFDYDNIGNRKTAQFGGDGSGLNLRGIGYAVNSLNQYTTITNLGYANILGAALATNGVWVNHGLAERKGEYFRRELSVANGNGPLWTNVTVVSATITNGGGLIVSDDRQTLVYDLDGNLAFDGTWSYEWDGENRLKVMTMTNVATIPNPQRKRLEFGYDHMNRRISKVVKTWNGSSFTSPVTNLFVYDGWNLLAVLTSDRGLLTSFAWGQDLSGTMDGAGGVGGLLMVVRHASPSTNCFVAFDGNGNVTALLNAVSGALEARYEYNPYGEILRTTGPLASANPFRWSTKCWDEESGLVYYGYRYYSPWLGRWVNRDPIEEGGGSNLSGFCQNSPLNRYDKDGRIAPLLAAALVVLEVSLMAYDVYDAIDTITDPEADSTDVLLSLGGLAGGTAAPGGGYGKMAKVTRGIWKTSQQYVRKFKHAADFGVAGDCNPMNVLKFRRAISEHRKAANTVRISGKYRGDGGLRDVDYFLDPKSGLVAIYDKKGNFVSAWKASADQVQQITKENYLW